MLKVRFETNKLVIWNFEGPGASVYMTIEPTFSQLQQLHDDIGQVIHFQGTAPQTHEDLCLLVPESAAKKLTGPVSTLSEDALGESVSQADGVGECTDPLCMGDGCDVGAKVL